ncbi:peptidase S8/S53 domain-containing protein [Cokeromyces recurvatus]|uniref:peptidase S8/S53 domain-containing protein n=1 Tax=Cokeromyces recurvatus TaxID=90255 RepID=UPI00221E9C95|nr:peptidase S8/S53 domain-containing protein [Cokeromyces recurvatus]KAI7906052.1 peptidase S8/S53 domain-containing protein [Cokeromyces recurvatus]
MKLHQVTNNNHVNSTNAIYNDTPRMNTVKTDSTHNFTHIKYNSIGKFRWYTGKFHSEDIENLLNTNATRKNITNNIMFNEDQNEPIHYWIKDVTFSLQEFIQTNPPSWGLDRIDQREGTDGYYKFASDQGKGVTVYLMDSGILEDHVDIAGRVTIGKTVVGDPDDPFDSNGHGTFVAGVCCGTKYGVAKGANIVSVKILDNDGNGHLSDILIGLQWIVKQHISQKNAKSIVNLSLGSFYSQVTNEAIQEAISLGIHFSIAAGNYGEDACKYSPGSTPGAITVGAINEDDSVSYYSNFGKCVDIFAPGTNIKSIWHTSKTATKTLTGTSMAAPHVAGTMAIFLSQADYTPSQLMNYLKSVSTLITEDFTINNTGIFYSDNKTIIDNAIYTGYEVKDRMDRKTFVNVLFSQPNDSQPFWIYGQSLNQAASLQKFTISSLLFIITFLVIL